MKGRDISSLSDDGYCHGEKVALFSACSPHKSFFAYRYFFRLCNVMFASYILSSCWFLNCAVHSKNGSLLTCK